MEYHACPFYEETATAMNSEQDRPFVCSAPGCSQRFPTEDHLMIHRHKHEMTLKFPSIKNDNILSDQTPTPTRFLKNCEEVGLFTDLDCSIEQEFCKAQEEEDSKQNISLHGSTGQNQHHSRMPNHDSSIVIQALPSPQSSSVITQAPSTNRPIGPMPNSLSSLLHMRNRPRQPLPASMAGTLPDPTMPGSSAVLMPMERQMSMSSSMMAMQGPAHNNSCSSPHVPGIHSEAKMLSPAAQQMQPTQTLQQPPSGGRRRRVVDEDPDERRRKFLERNRAAATRCRQKRKVWVMSLEKKAEELTQTNMQLQNEVTMLKNEVTQLKQLLLTHKDCPVTARQKESQGYLSPESSPAGSPAPACSQQQVIQHNTITTSSTAPGGGPPLGPMNHHVDINPIH
ncbi:cyclic AMP-responsive element-binding protein 5 isoform X3 [Paramormyrops kingsleyae]|uniref:cyclic AMP-responsive element-binding protein 5 isoform X3 n=1 Tax=Paramormyrops kingsleyae TaxID=1676925 RepID=UPI003B97C6FF